MPSIVLTIPTNAIGPCLLLGVDQGAYILPECVVNDERYVIILGQVVGDDRFGVKWVWEIACCKRIKTCRCADGKRDRRGCTCV